MEIIIEDNKINNKKPLLENLSAVTTIIDISTILSKVISSIVPKGVVIVFLAIVPSTASSNPEIHSIITAIKLFSK